MTKEQLSQGNDLSGKIEYTEQQLHLWKNAAGLESNGIYVKDGYYTKMAEASPETFSVVKALNIHYWEQTLAALKKRLAEI